jgi:cellulose synthase/poly-beta-1,6-N-acetylglucosamine synthase-like glycosyltransferase
MGRMFFNLLSALSPWRQAHTLLSLSVLLLWSVSVSLLIRGRRYYRSLVDIPFAPEEMENLPRLSILVPACNEGDTVERAMRSLLALDYPDLEIIAIDDRSTDETGAILDRLAATDARLRVRHITQLPHGWLGKNHAMQVASEEATGAWLLFTDADVVFAPDTLRRAVAYACTRDVDHLVLSPRCETHDFWERLFVNYFGLMFSFRTRPWEVANPHSRAYVGLGAFNMVRADAYRRFGGHRALPMEVLDDSKLGKVVKRAGFRQELLDGGDLISVRWVVGLQGVINGMTKNAFAGFEFKLLYEFGAILLLAYTALYPVAALFLPGWPTRLMALATLAVMVIAAGVMRRVTEANRWYGLGYPLAALILIYIMLRSTWRTYRQRGIIWRGTLYPLDELRKGVV